MHLLVQATLRNVLILVLSMVLFQHIHTTIGEIVDRAALETITLFTGLILVMPLFAWYEFTYENLGNHHSWQSGIAHAFISTVLLSIIILLVMIDALFLQLIGSFAAFRGVLCLMLMSVFLYDYWDIFRYIHK